MAFGEECIEGGLDGRKKCRIQNTFSRFRWSMAETLHDLQHRESDRGLNDTFELELEVAAKIVRAPEKDIRQMPDGKETGG